ncbi:cupin domain-containing protein, partial [Pseudomonas sp. RTI1]|uniref:cupin domain-containing protein n=1 Tax=Pseudomonas sp. RTI1 TaxID=3048636 RepID=UPI002B226EEE
DGSKIMGTCICTPGKWRVVFVKWVYCHFQEGYFIITPDGMEPILFSACDIFFVETCMIVFWELVETVS